MNSLQEIAGNAGKVLAKNSPHILTGLGCAGVVSTAVLTGRAVPKALRIIEDEEYRNHRTTTKTDKVKLTWKVFIPAGVIGATSIACIIGANTVNTRRNAALAALYSLSEATFRDYKSEVTKQIGKNKETAIRDNIVKEKMEANPIDHDSVIMTGNGDILCVDLLSGRPFKSNYEQIRQIVNDLNYQLRTDMWMDLNDLYFALGLPPNDLGNLMGFDIDYGQIEPEYSTQLDTNGNPCLTINFNVRPKYMPK